MLPSPHQPHFLFLGGAWRELWDAGREGALSLVTSAFECSEEASCDNLQGPCEAAGCSIPSGQKDIKTLVS